MPFMQSENILSLHQKLDILHETYLFPNAILRTAFMYYIDPHLICRWKTSLTGWDEEKGQHQLA